jgi:hypothetical protein
MEQYTILFEQIEGDLYKSLSILFTITNLHKGISLLTHIEVYCTRIQDCSPSSHGLILALNDKKIGIFSISSVYKIGEKYRGTFMRKGRNMAPALFLIGGTPGLLAQRVAHVCLLRDIPQIRLLRQAQ